MSVKLQEASDEAVFLEASRRLDLPFPINHFYLPLRSTSSVIASGADRVPLVPPDELFDTNTIEEFGKYIVGGYNRDILQHDEVKLLDLGLGYGYIEAYIYNTICRAFQPDTITEIGSGVSTWYAREATADYGAKITCVEPYPAKGLPGWCSQNNINLVQKSLQSCAADLVFGHRPILFVDSTHVATVGGELQVVFLELLPRLPSGALIHFHDIFLPFACLHEGHNSFKPTVNWYESTLLCIFLYGRKDYEVVLPQYWMRLNDRLRPVLCESIPRFAETNYGGSSFWIRKK